MAGSFGELMSAWLGARRAVLAALDFGAITPYESQSELSVMAVIVNGGIDSSELEAVTQRFWDKAYHFSRLVNQNPIIDGVQTQVGESFEIPLHSSKGSHGVYSATVVDKEDWI